MTDYFRGTPRPVLEHFSGGPESLMRVDGVGGDADEATASMQTGTWMLGVDGRAAAGSLGVLTDDMFGSCVLAHRPEGWWAVTTELALEFGSELPMDGSPLTAVSHGIQLDASGGLGQGAVRDTHGRTVATGTQRLRFLPGAPDGNPSSSAGAAQVDDCSSMLDLLGARRGAEGGLELPMTASLANPVGNLHGGVLVSVAEQAALAAVQDGGDPLGTASLRATFVRSIPLAGTITFTTATVHRGRTLAVVHVTARRPDGRVGSIATVTLGGSGNAHTRTGIRPA